MDETPDTETADEVVRRRLAEIRQWQREGKSVGWITKQLGIARSSYQRVLAQVEAEKAEAKDVLQGDEGTPTTTEALTRQVYTGRQTSDSDAAVALPDAQHDEVPLRMPGDPQPGPALVQEHIPAARQCRRVLHRPSVAAPPPRFKAHTRVAGSRQPPRGFPHSRRSRPIRRRRRLGSPP